MAAMHAFRDLAPPRRWKKMARWLRRVRRAAGAARNDDVLAIHLEQLAADNAVAGAAYALARVERERQQAQQAIDELCAHFTTKDLPRRIQALVKRVRWRAVDPEPDCATAARAALDAAWTSFRHAATGDLSDATALHALRIEGKRLRYTMEIFAAVFPASFREELYPRVEQLQELLGEVNDRSTACARIAQWLEADDDAPAPAGAIEGLLAYELEALARGRQQFLDWWASPEIDRLQGALEPFLVAMPPSTE
jgi:CHAD domain-containing protein